MTSGGDVRQQRPMQQQQQHVQATQARSDPPPPLAGDVLHRGTAARRGGGPRRAAGADITGATSGSGGATAAASAAARVTPPSESPAVLKLKAAMTPLPSQRAAKPLALAFMEAMEAARVAPPSTPTAATTATVTTTAAGPTSVTSDTTAAGGAPTAATATGGPATEATATATMPASTTATPAAANAAAATAVDPAAQRQLEAALAVVTRYAPGAEAALKQALAKSSAAATPKSGRDAATAATDISDLDAKAAASRSPLQEAAHRRELHQALVQQAADTATRAAEAARRRYAKRDVVVADAAAEIAKVEAQLNQLAKLRDEYIAHELVADAEFAAKDEAAAEETARRLQAASLAIEEADKLVQDAGDARALRPPPARQGSAPAATSAAAMTPVDDLDDDGTDEMESAVGDDDDAAREFVDYLAPPQFSEVTVAESDLPAVAQARARLCHWFAQPARVQLTYTALGISPQTVMALVGEAAWRRSYVEGAIVTEADAVPRPIGGVLMEAIASLPEQVMKAQGNTEAAPTAFITQPGRERAKKAAATTARGPKPKVAKR